MKRKLINLFNNFEEASLIRIEYNIINGIIFEILTYNNRSLFSICYGGWKEYFILDICFLTIIDYNYE